MRHLSALFKFLMLYVVSYAGKKKQQHLRGKVYEHKPKSMNYLYF